MKQLPAKLLIKSVWQEKSNTPEEKCTSASDRCTNINIKNQQ
jgi:hypothetical protein